MRVAGRWREKKEGVVTALARSSVTGVLRDVGLSESSRSVRLKAWTSVDGLSRCIDGREMENQ